MEIIYQFDPCAPFELRAPKSNGEALRLLEQGNDRYHAMVERVQNMISGDRNQPPMVVPVNPVQLGIPMVEGLEPAHAPFALVLGCSDARAPVELILDCPANDVFVVRVAGNVLGFECLGSVDYAATVLRSSLQSVVVMGHTQCGAVGAAVDVYLSPSQFAEVAFSHAVRSLADRILVSVRNAARGLEKAKGANVTSHEKYREWLVNTSCYLNAAVTAFDLHREMIAMTKGLPVSYTVYDMGHSCISSVPVGDEVENTPRFAPAPRDAEDFERIVADVIARLD